MGMYRPRRFAKTAIAITTLGALCCLTACAGFFPPLNSTTTSTGSSSGDYFYVANASTDTLNGFSIGTGTLTAVSTSNYALDSGLAPTSVVVSRQNSIVYVGGNGAIQAFAIGTSGALSALTGGGTTVSSGNVVSMATSPDGQWLLALVSTTLGTAQVVVYGINTSSGLLTQNGSALTVTFTGTVGKVTPGQIRIAPSAAYVATSLGAAGDAFFTFNTATGVATQTTNILPTVTSGSYNSDNALTFSTNSGYLYIGTTGQSAGRSLIATYPISSSGVLGTGVTVATGDAPAALEVDSTGAYLYSANRGSANITGYTISSGALTALASSPFGASSGIGALARDKSGSYVIGVASTAGASGTYDVTLYGFDAYTPGRLDEVATAASGSDPAGSVAVGATH